MPACEHPYECLTIGAAPRCARCGSALSLPQLLLDLYERRDQLAGALRAIADTRSPFATIARRALER